MIYPLRKKNIEELFSIYTLIFSLLPNKHLFETPKITSELVTSMSFTRAIFEKMFLQI